MSRIENLLERVRLKRRRARTSRSTVTASTCGDRGEGERSAFSQIPWDDVLVICIDHKLKDWQIPGPPVCEGEDDSEDPMPVFRCKPADDVYLLSLLLFKTL